MGACLSSSASPEEQQQDFSTANVIWTDGGLKEFPIPITVSQIMEKETLVPSSYFICNSDRLYYDDFITPLNPEHDLQAGQIYFLLPNTKLHYRLTASDMAAMAVKASVALQQQARNNNKSHRHRRSNRNNKKKGGRIAPALELNEDLISSSDHGDGFVMKKNPDNINNKPFPGLGASRSGSVRKFQRYTSRRAKLAVRSFRLRLTTIYEGTVLQFH